MPSFRSGIVVVMLAERPGLQRVDVDLGDGPEHAYALTHLTGPVAVGDRVVVNTTAVDLGLGTGGWHVIHWNLNRKDWSEAGPGHIMKLRYTPLQADTGATDEELGDDVGLDGTPVVVAGLHSQLAAIAVGFKEAAPGATLAYVMTDGAALPIVISDLVADLRGRGLVDVTVTAGHAFGGDHEAVDVPSALVVARRAADAAVVVMGPGVVGTGSTLGTTAVEVAPILDTVVALRGNPIACLRASAADPRPRHRGLSHHSATALGLLCRSSVTVAVPVIEGAGEETASLRAGLDRAGIPARHVLVDVTVGDPPGRLRRHGLRVSSMGRPAEDDPLLFGCGMAAGTLAGNLRAH